MNIQRLRDYHESEDGKKAFTEFAEKLEREEIVINNHVERIGRIIDLPAFIEKVIAKYSSTEYRDRWYDRGIEHQTICRGFCSVMLRNTVGNAVTKNGSGMQTYSLRHYSSAKVIIST